MPVLDITIIGPGRLGGALALALSRSGSKVSQIVYHSRPRAKRLAAKLHPTPNLVPLGKVETIASKLVLITVPDDAITDTVNAISNAVVGVGTIFHTSGSIPSDVLAPLRANGRTVASIHPLASVSTWEDGVQRFRGSFFCVEGDPKAVTIGKRLVSQLGGRTFTIPAQNKPLYHVAALTAAGQVTALFDIAIGLMMKAGVQREMAKKLLQPLLEGVAKNLATEDTSKSLTGTYARADERTMNRHLLTLGQNATRDEIVVYLELALRSIDLAEKTGVDCSKLESMRKTLMVAKRKIEC